MKDIMPLISDDLKKRQSLALAQMMIRPVDRHHMSRIKNRNKLQLW